MEVIKTYLQSAGPDVGSEDSSPINSFYKDKVVFITGATGFMGKVGREESEEPKDTTAAGAGGEASAEHLGVKDLPPHTTQERRGHPAEAESTAGLPLLQQGPEGARGGAQEGRGRVWRHHREEARTLGGGGEVCRPASYIVHNKYLRMLADSVNIVFHSAATVRFDEDMSKVYNQNINDILK